MFVQLIHLTGGTYFFMFFFGGVQIFFNLHFTQKKIISLGDEGGKDQFSFFP